MSSETIAFALDQRYLPPIEQLVLIVISDSCDETFTLNHVESAISKHTRLSSSECMDAFNALCEKEIIFLSQVPHAGSPEYCILTERS